MRITVQDSGIGISPDAQARLFRPFEQADSGTTRRYGGTGLGLAIVKRLVALMGGAIRLESQPNVGTTVTIDLTLDISDSPRSPTSVPFNGRALVVESDPTTCDIASTYLRASGLECQVIDDAAAALEHLRLHPDYQVVVIGLGGAGSSTQGLRTAVCADPVLGKLHRILLVDGPFTTDLMETALARPLKRRQLEETLRAWLAAPQIVPPDAETLAPELDIRLAGSDRDRPRLLLAEDNPLNQTVVTLQLKKLGYDVDVVADGAAAVDAYRAGPQRYCVVLMDCQMPRLDGFEATREIRSFEAIHKLHIPILALTANALPEDRQLCLTAGMDDYIGKPVRLHDLDQALNRWGVACG